MSTPDNEWFHAVISGSDLNFGSARLAVSCVTNSGESAAAPSIPQNKHHCFFVLSRRDERALQP